MTLTSLAGRFFSLTAVLALLAASGLQAQRFSNSSTVRGEITSDGGLVGNDLMVELHGLGAGGLVERTPADMSGSFTFDRIPTGEYQLRVLDRQGRVLRQEFVRVSGFQHHLSVRVPEQRVERPVSGTVSVERLQRNIPKSAEREFRRGAKAAEKGETEKAIEHFKTAIEIYPAYMEAYNNLGARYLLIGEMEKAAAEFQKAVHLDANSASANCNLALALHRLQRYPEAEAAARQAVRSDPASAKGRFVLGSALYAQNQASEEALRNLEIAADEFPKARLAVADILVRQGEQTRAAAELREYLSGKPEDREQVEAWLARLEQWDVVGQ